MFLFFFWKFDLNRILVTVKTMSYFSVHIFEKKGSPYKIKLLKGHILYHKLIFPTFLKNAQIIKVHYLSVMASV